VKIDELPDYPALKQLSAALWKVGKARGAAVLVGAGFSRNADRLNNNTPEAPLWNDLSRAMTAQLYSEGLKTPKDPLRLAEEYRASFGRAALEALIRDRVRDEEWLPGRLHKRLTKLPWTDILTTNWDTLLERAALENLGQTYETVRSIGDIAATRAPRVVKLHGSLPSNRPFIISEEDYRTYPRVFAPFVNLVQQVLLENELCLLGFSGDDPNFLEWSGWVRDQLGAAARRMHLVGALKLSSAERRVLESRNISVIDLTLAVGRADDPHAVAAEIFLEFLERSKPRASWDWPEQDTAPGRVSPLEPKLEDVVAHAMQLTGRWEGQRRTYPGWVVCPYSIRERCKTDTINQIHAVRKALDTLQKKDLGRLLFEAIWRHEVLYIPILPWIQGYCRDAVRNDDCWVNRDARNLIALALLRSAREERDVNAFAEWTAYLETQQDLGPEVAAGLCYQRCLWARDELDFPGLKVWLAKLSGLDPVWKVRRAALYCELGDFSAAGQEALECVREIREHFYRDRGTVWTISRLAWAQFVSRQIRPWTEPFEDGRSWESEALRLRFFETQSDPWEVLREVARDIDKNLRGIRDSERTKEPLFQPGVYREHLTLKFGTKWETEPLYLLLRISDTAGVPFRGDHSDIFASRMAHAEQLTRHRYEDEADYLRVLRIAQANDDIVSAAFSRVQIARLQNDRCSSLRIVLHRALDYALDQLNRRDGFADQFWSQRAAAYGEMLARLSVRLEPAVALAFFRKALEYANDPRWTYLEMHKTLEHLLEHSLSAVPPAMRRTLVTELLRLPLPVEAGPRAQMANDWPEPAEWIPESLISRPEPDLEFASRVAVLIDRVADSDLQNRSRAARRLAKLYEAGVLADTEAVRFGEALWSRRTSENGLPADTGLYSSMFLLLPSPDPTVARRLLLERTEEPSSADYLVSLSGAVGRRASGSRLLTLTRDRALAVLDGILHWKPRERPEFDLGGVGRENDMARRALGRVLADGVLPTLNAADLSSEVVNTIFELTEGGVAPSLTQAMPGLVQLRPDLRDRSAKLVLQMIFSADTDENASGFHALSRWAQLVKSNLLTDIPSGIVDAAVYTVEIRRHPGLLQALKGTLHLLNLGLLTGLEPARLVSALRTLFLETDYSRITSGQSEEIFTITLVRAATVKLAVGLKSRGFSDPQLDQVLTDAERDPLPEVRFAISEPEES